MHAMYCQEANDTVAHDAVRSAAPPRVYNLSPHKPQAHAALTGLHVTAQEQHRIMVDRVLKMGASSLITFLSQPFLITPAAHHRGIPHPYWLLASGGEMQIQLGCPTCNRG